MTSPASTYIFSSARNSQNFPLFLENSKNLAVLTQHPSKKVGEMTYYLHDDKKTVYVETIKSHERSELEGVGFFLMKMAICSSPSCRTTLVSEGLGERTGERSPVLFYCRLGFVPKFTYLSQDEHTRQNASLLKRELEMAQNQNRVPTWIARMPMSLPESARHKWQVVSVSDRFLQEKLCQNQRIIKTIHDYFLNFSSSDFLPGTELSLPTDHDAYIFQTNTGKEVVANHFFSPPNSIKVWNHKICVASKEVGIIEIKCDLKVANKIKKLINLTHYSDHVDYIPGISFFLMKKTLECCLVDNNIPLKKMFAHTQESFFYWQLGFRFCREEVDEGQVGQLEEEFARAQQENRKPRNCPSVYGELMLSEESKASWSFILKTDAILQKLFRKKQKIIQIVQKYLL